ncbi:hypothetical protein [Diaphorobacter caeni]|uniref:hypothetical protein n=1 Tax=Diaphorobacter caeni TaxID=2784387 RepID=UPI00188DE0EE|nr:hypothetical protein [Diaphorobacter caeni]MBF5007605.1 hypothetical protein [Diaphorobacter caeni]
MKHLRWIITILIFITVTETVKGFHGWTGYWIASAVLTAFGIVNYFDGYFARQRELEGKLDGLRSSSQIPPHRPPRTP